ncbi:ketoacyl-synt-domain-containing protein [Obba rivulosa]|uniref:Ketoacyl-synt-domain-containing protein n=1 Tax=Obba rivulosa TaxID=1052685 RepID=A0A8E2AGL6_9APHY|nr:ketoacyl-synt-domain-containing protein [Obba rivulosa]
MACSPMSPLPTAVQDTDPHTPSRGRQQLEPSLLFSAVTPTDAAGRPPTSSDIYLFDGQGNAASFTERTLQIALRDCEAPLPRSLLLACHQAFLQELDALPDNLKGTIGLDSALFRAASALLNVPEHLRTNAVLANISLYLGQLLRWLAHHEPGVDNSAQVNLGPTNQINGLPQCVGFSTGIFAAAVVASSNDILTFFINAVEVMRALFWLGARCQQFSAEKLSNCPDIASGSWSLVLFGSSRSDVDAAVARFNADHDEDVCVTAVTSRSCVTVSGRSDILIEFEKGHLPANTLSTKFLDIHTLYHSTALKGTKDQTLEDIQTREIHVPTYGALKVPLRSTVTGDLIDADHYPDNSTLLKDLLNMTLIHPVDFERVLEALRQDLASQRSACRLVNVGPCTGLWRTAARHLHGPQMVTLVDWSTPEEESLSLRAPNLPCPSGTHEPIAIVGMAVTFPGARDAEGLWDVLKNGTNTVSEIPKERFDASIYTAPDTPHNPAHLGNFLSMDDAAGFDAPFFRVAPRAARSMDPQQRVLLHIAKHALDDAGFVPRATRCADPRGVGVFVGAATGDYVENLREDIDAFYSTGTLRSFLSGRVSHAFGFGGPSEVVDTACSSSLVAIHHACRALANGDCDAAIAGGVNVITSPEMFLGLGHAHFLSPTGQCRPWDAAADGYSRAEGCGLFVLKRLVDALAERDRIRGIIRGAEVTHSGQAASITHPHVPAQIALFERLLARARVRPAEVSVLEAHGTGTQAGDPAEMESRAIPAGISLQTLNPRIAALDLSDVCFDREMAEWEQQAGARRLAVLNNFGASGSNAALLLEEPPSPAPRACDNASPAFVLGLSCDSADALEKLRAAYLRHLQELVHSELDLADFAYSATARRMLYRHRIAVSAASKAELCERLRDAQAAVVDPNAEGAQAFPDKVIFVFSGQGAQHVGMGRDLYASLPLFRQIVDESHDKLLAWGHPGVLRVINPPAGVTPVTDIVALHSAMFVLEYALASLFMSWGIKPDIAVGHSLGEYVALAVAEVMTPDEALRLVAARARLINEKCVKMETGMLAVQADVQRIAEMLESEAEFRQLSIACYNSDIDCVVAGPGTCLSSLEDMLRESGCRCLRLDVAFAYHTSAMQPIVDGFRDIIDTIRLSPPTIPVLSNVLGTLVCPEGDVGFDAEYFCRHCVEPVRFSDAVQHLVANRRIDGYIWIELGPHPTTLPMLRSICSEGFLSDVSRMHFVPSLRRDTSDWEDLSATLTKLYCTSANIDWRAVFRNIASDARLVDLPAYPLERTRYWVPYRAKNIPETPLPQGLVPQLNATMVGRCVAFSERDQNATFETCLSNGPLVEPIKGHRVAGHALCPASIYLELAFQAVGTMVQYAASSQTDLVMDVADVTYTSALVLNTAVRQLVQTEIMRTPASSEDGSLRTWTFSISSKVGGCPDGWQAHCSGKFFESRTVQDNDKMAVTSLLSSRVQSILARPSSFMEYKQFAGETFRKATIYNLLFPRIVEYTTAYQTLEALTIQSDAASGIHVYASACVPTVPGLTEDAWSFRQVFIDTLLHTAGFAVNHRAKFSPESLYICHAVEKLCGDLQALRFGMAFGVYVHVASDAGSAIETTADAYAVETDANGRVKRVITQIMGICFRRSSLGVLRDIFGRKLFEADPAGAYSQPRLGTAEREKEHNHRGPNPASSPVAEEQSWATGTTPAFLPLRSPDRMADRLIQLIASTCGVPASDIHPRTRLAELGIDSLMSIELAGKFGSLFGRAPGSTRNAWHDIALCNYRTIGDLIKACEDQEEVVSSPTLCNFSHDRPDRTVVRRSPGSAGRIARDHSASTSSALLEFLATTSRVVPNPVFDMQSPDYNLRSITENVLGEDAPWPPQDVVAENFACNGAARRRLSGNSAELGEDAVVGSQQAPCSSYGKSTVTFTSLTRPNPLLLHDARADGFNRCRSPLFLIHDGSGTAHPYARLDYTGIGRDVYGVHNPKFILGQRWQGGVVEMAECYKQIILQTLRTGVNSTPRHETRFSCLLGGWSFGGVVAFELARQLSVAGMSVLGIILIDVPPPSTSVPLPDAVIDYVLNTPHSPKRDGDSHLTPFTTATDAAEDLLKPCPDHKSSYLTDLARTQMLYATRALVSYEADSSPVAHIAAPQAVFIRARDPAFLGREQFASDATNFSSQLPGGQSDVPGLNAVEEWTKCLGRKAPVLDAPGNHFTMFDEQHVSCLFQRQPSYQS